MVKLIALYGHPESTEDFESHYLGVHVPLARTLPNLVRVETSRPVSDPHGGRPPYYRISELSFPDMGALREALASEAGRAVADDVANFATGGVTMLVSAVDDRG